MDKCKFEHKGYCYNCGATRYIGKCKKPCDTIIPVTNADRIRAMSDEELADLFSAIADDGRSCTLICTNYDKCKRNNAIEVICRNHYLGWLKQPVKEGDNDG